VCGAARRAGQCTGTSRKEKRLTLPGEIVFDFVASLYFLAPNGFFLWREIIYLQVI